jgi:putative transposase
MRKGRISEGPIVNVLKEYQAGIPAVELCCEHGISDATYYTLRTKIRGSDLTRMPFHNCELTQRPCVRDLSRNG